MEKWDDDAYLVTGNQMHYPIKDFVVALIKMMRIVDGCFFVDKSVQLI